MVLKQILLDNLFNLIFKKEYNVFGLSAVNYFLNGNNDYDGPIDIFCHDDNDVCYLAHRLKKLLTFSFHIQTSYKRYEEYDECSYDSDDSDNDDELIRLAQMNLTYKYEKGITF